MNNIMHDDMTQHELILLLLMAEMAKPLELSDFIRELDERYVKGKDPSLTNRFEMILTTRLMQSLQNLQDRQLVVREENKSGPALIRPYGENGKMVGFHPLEYRLTDAGICFAQKLQSPKPQPALKIV